MNFRKGGNHHLLTNSVQKDGGFEFVMRMVIYTDPAGRSQSFVYVRGIMRYYYTSPMIPSFLDRLWLVVLAFNQVSAMGQKMERFNDDLMIMMANIEPVFILNPDEQDSIYKWAVSKPVSLISATGVPQETDIIIDHLGSFIKADNVDYIFFGEGTSNEELIRNVVNSLGIMMDNKITVVIPHGHSIGIQMRLDSRLFLYEDTSEGITLFESYQIR